MARDSDRAARFHDVLVRMRERQRFYERAIWGLIAAAGAAAAGLVAWALGK